ncbi:MAG: ABC transporter permease [Bacteroidetes bacterium]|nr:ABC transporter permease [Bacteroidota bacterium]MCY4233130.1 ABC transporter permease [Bacteroidota bacterium]
MSFKVFIAWRYLRGAQGGDSGGKFLRFISLVAVGSVSVGVATLLLALSIVRGFSQEIHDKITGFGAHIQVENIRHGPLIGSDELSLKIQQQDSVISLQPVVTEFVLLRRSSQDIDGVGLWGTDRLPDYLAQHIINGSDNIEPENSPKLVVGNILAENLNLKIGNLVTLLSIRNLSSVESLFGSRPRFKQFEISGIYETFLIDFDETYIFTDINSARQLLGYKEDHVTRFDVMLEDASLAPSISLLLEDSLGFGVLVRTIFEIYRGLFAWIDLQEAIVPLVISVLIFVAAFSVMGMLLMIVLEKTREIGILTSMGASQQRIQQLYIYLGFFVGSLGTGIGLLLAVILGFIQARFGIIGLPVETYFMDTVPISLMLSDFGIVAVVSIILCLLASYFPSRIASRISPLQVLRFR